MKLFLFLLVLEALPLATSAHPLFSRQNQQALAISQPLDPPSSVTSFDSSSDLDSSSGSGSDSGSKKFSPFNALKKIKPSSSEFRCHRYPQNSILALGELSAYVTDLLRSYQEKVFEGKGDPERPLFETCYAGYQSSDVSPSIYFANMKAKQMGVVEKLFKNQLLMKFPNVRIVKASNAIAVVMEDAQKIKRRNTV